MADVDGLGLGSRRLPSSDDETAVYVMRQRPLHRVLSFLGRSIDDVINDPIAKNQVRGYFKLYKQIERSSEVTELEKQWNMKSSSTSQMHPRSRARSQHGVDIDSGMGDLAASRVSPRLGAR